MIKAAICDDDKLFTGQLERHLHLVAEDISIPLETEIFFDGAGFLEELNRGTRYDIIFMDIEMTQMDGISAAKQLRHLDPTALLVYISGYDQYFRQLFEVGVFRFLDKPVNTEQLSECFVDACRQISVLNIHVNAVFSESRFERLHILKVTEGLYVCIFGMGSIESFMEN